MGYSNAFFGPKILGQTNARKRQAVRERNVKMFGNVITARDVKRLAGECGGDFRAIETGGAQSVFARDENGAADAAACPMWVNEKGANTRGVGGWIDERVSV